PTPQKKVDPERWAECKHIADEILGFRGSSPFQVGVWDASVTPPAFLTYDGFALLQSATYSVASIEECQALRRQHLRPEHQRALDEKLRHTMKGKNDTPLMLKIESFNAERESLTLTISGVDLRQNTQQILVLSQFAVIEPRSLALADFN